MDPRLREDDAGGWGQGGAPNPSASLAVTPGGAQRRPGTHSAGVPLDPEPACVDPRLREEDACGRAKVEHQFLPTLAVIPGGA